MGEETAPIAEGPENTHAWKAAWKRRRTRRRIILIILAALAVYGIIDYFFIEDAREYDLAVYYENTKLVRMAGRDDDWAYAESPDHWVLVWDKGKEHSTITSAHPWTTQLSIEMPGEPRTGRFVIGKDPLRVGCFAYLGRRFWTIGKGGVRGFVDVKSMEDGRLQATYEIEVHAVTYRDSRVETFSFTGDSHFRRDKPPREDAIAASGPLFVSPADNAAGTSGAP